jgi:iron complex outermembrane receptor protein
VLTPTRLKQAPRDVPASVTVLTGEMLSIYGLTGANEAVRMVAGSVPARLAGANYDLKLKNKASQGPQHVTVLIDGVQIGGDDLSEDADWADVPIGIEDIERIEVTRGPGTAGYGYALTFAIINIVTKHPADTERAYGRITYGEYDTISALGRAGLNLGPGSLRLTLAHRQRGAIDDDRASTARPDPVSLDRMTLRSTFALDGASTLAIDMAYLSGEREGDVAAPVPLGRQALRSGYASVNWTRSLDPSNELSMRLEQWASTVDTDAAGCQAEEHDAWDLAAPADGFLQAWPLAKPKPVCNSTLAYQRRMRLELQDMHVFDNGVRVVAGVGWRQEQARVRSLDLQRWSTAFRRGFVAAEWEALPDVSINLGASVDDGAAANYDRSMRAGVNWRMSPDQTLRAAWSIGDWASDKLPVFETVKSVVTQERMKAWDLGYLLALPDQKATVEARAFWTRLKGRVQTPGKPDPSEQTARGELYGVEFRAAGDISDRWSGYVGVSTMTEGSNTGLPVHPRPRPWSASVGVSVDLGAGWRASTAYFGSTRIGTSAQTAGRADLVLLKDFRWDEVRARAAMAYRRADHLKVFTPDGKTILTENGTADGYFVSLQVAY